MKRGLFLPYCVNRTYHIVSYATESAPGYVCRVFFKNVTLARNSEAP